MQVEKIVYEINWVKFKVGCSFFVPCLDPRKSRKKIVDVTKRLGYKVATKVVITDGVRGIRIWRII
jgi:hypothetical protein|tara:strand:- start:714 stop:911 length:198 start_codon:yes stop_codon:yes gene_type:complete